VITKSRKSSRTRQRLGANYDWKKVESRVRKFYAKKAVRAQFQKRVARNRPVGYVEGPPTLNNQPHMGNVRGRIIKDLWYRFNTMNGENIVFRGGWDTQGLPVELQAEKELGLTGSKWENLRQVGIERLVQASKNLINKYRSSWEEADRLIGLMLDQKKAYMTYRDEYIEREWRYLEIAWNQGLLGEGYKVVPYCPSCQTALSKAELALGGYEQLEDPSLYYKVRVEDGSYLIVWTTMPFTVVTDELVGVKPDSAYEFVQVGGEVWIVGAERAEAMAAELGLSLGGVAKTVKGSELEGLRYDHPLLEEIPGLKRLREERGVHTVVAEDFVDTSTGTGIVHMAPANGEDDFTTAQKRGLPVFSPFDDEVKFTDEAGRFKGLFARDADALVVEALRERGALVSAGRIVHDYPVCWRSDHRLVWLARREYFYWVDRIRDKVIRAAEKVDYFVESPKNRFLEFIRESPPWGITRERVWGTPLPIWVCQGCGEKVTAFSRRRIRELALEMPDGPSFELHRPWIDRVVLRCPKCGGKALREPFVLDTWHNSGSAPFCSFTDEEYARLIPARFLTEGIDQTRGWAYTLLILNVLMTGRPQAPYDAFLFQGHVLDEQGRKMSKSLGNVVWGLDLLRSKSVDLSRFYLMWKSAPEDSLSMDMKELDARPYQVLNTLYHLHVYLSQNGELDGYNPKKHTLKWASRSGLLTTVDRWLICKLSEAEKAVAKSYERTRYNDVCRSLESLVISYLSQNYVRLVRGELWSDEPEERKRRLAIYATLGHVLRRADLMLHPVTPFTTEYLYQMTFVGARSWVRPLLCEPLLEAPPFGASRTAEATVEFALVTEEAANSARTKAKMKRRWPLRSLRVLVPRRSLKDAKRASRLTSSLCNVKDVVITSSARDFPANFRLEPNTSRVGQLFKERTREVIANLRPLVGQQAVSAYLSGRPTEVETPSGRVELPLATMDMKVEPHEGFEVGERSGVFVAVEKTRDEGLVAEGLVRDVARRLQSLRKAKGYTPSAVLGRAIVAGLQDDDLRLMEKMKEQLAFLVRVKSVRLLGGSERKPSWTEEDLDGRPIYLYVG
jgi:isoleucyl-tRNA synthetase